MNVVLRSEHLDLLSICTGGGGLDLGVELAIPSARSVVLVEREAFAVAQLVSAMEAGHLHQAPVWSNARTFDGRAWRGCVDGLIGGIPCQAHSLAGKKRGSFDERDLWSPARRIIVQSRPWFVLIENVGGMLSPGDDEIAGAERVWRDLRKLGFAVEAGLFRAAEVGASHERERIFILGASESVGQANAAIVRRDGPSAVAGGKSEGDGEGRLREFEGSCDHMGSVGLADASSDGQLWSAKPDVRSVGPEQQTPRRRDLERCDRSLEPVVGLADADREGLERSEPGGAARPGREGSAAQRNGSALVDSFSGGHDRGTPDQVRRARGRNALEGAGGRIGLFPPGPGDIAGWRAVIERTPEFEPAVRRVADGMASRVDELRMLGNGVVPLQAAYAVRTLATRLAERGSTGATRLVRMMEAST